MRHSCKYLTGLILSSVVLPVSAEISMRGFASVVAGQVIDGDTPVNEYGDELNLQNDSLAALQFTADISDNLHATVQMIARGRNDYEATMEWAYITYDVSDTFQVSAGRIRSPFYRYSDFFDVRYAIPWVSVPNTVYDFDFPGYDGISLVKTNNFGSWDSTFQVIYGSLEGEIPVHEFHIEAEGLTGINWTLVRDWLTLRAGWVTSNVTLAVDDYNQLAQAVQATGLMFGQDTAALEQEILIESDRGQFFSGAVGIDYNDWLFNAEFVSYTVDDSLLAETDAYYIMLGKRFGVWTPALTFSNASGEPSDDIYDAVPQGPLAANLNPVFANVIASSEQDTDLLIATLRYDFQPSAALKFEYIHREDISEQNAGLFRVGIDVVF